MDLICPIFHIPYNKVTINFREVLLLVRIKGKHRKIGGLNLYQLKSIIISKIED